MFHRTLMYTELYVELCVSISFINVPILKNANLVSEILKVGIDSDMKHVILH